MRFSSLPTGVVRAASVMVLAFGLHGAKADPALLQQAEAAVVDLYDQRIKLDATPDGGAGLVPLLRGMLVAELVPVFDAAIASEEPVIDFDPFYAAQDFEITDLVVTAEAADEAKAAVKVSFKNFGQTTTLTFELVREGAMWKVGDIVYADGYRFRQIMTEPAQ